MNNGTTLQADKTASIINAYTRGTLLAHMLEVGTYYGLSEYALGEIQNFFSVMKGEAGKRFIVKIGGTHREAKIFRDVRSSSAGYRGLATTALKRGLPVNLWTLKSAIGILLDAEDTGNVKPVYVSSADCGSVVIDHCLRARTERRGDFSFLKEWQGFGKADFITLNLADHNVVEKQTPLALSALAEMWYTINDIGWDRYIQMHHSEMLAGINEVDVIAHMRGVKGLIVSEIFPTGSKSYETFYEHLDIAKTIRLMLHPDGDLPVFSYNPNRAKDPLIALAENEISNPDLFLKRFYLGARGNSGGGMSYSY